MEHEHLQVEWKVEESVDSETQLLKVFEILLNNINEYEKEKAGEEL